MTGRPTVLIVDDEEDVVEIYALALHDEYDVRKANDGEEALEQVDDEVDVVLLDRRMPKLSGHEVLGEIRERGIDVRVAMVTAVDPDFDVAEMNFDAYLTKPVDGSEVHETVDELVSLSEQDERTKELFSVAERKATLEAEKTEDELAGSDEYQRLRERAAEIDADAVAAIGDLDGEGFEKMVSGLPEERLEED